MWTRINVLFRRRNCSEAFSVWTGALSVIQFATLHFDLKRLFTKTRFLAISAPIKVFRLDSDRFKNLSDTERSTFNSGAEQYCSGAETALKAAFLVWTDTLSGTLSVMLRFTIRYSVNIAWATEPTMKTLDLTAYWLSNVSCYFKWLSNHTPLCLHWQLVYSNVN